MSLGTKLQAVALKVNKKLGTQDAPLTFRKQIITENSKLGLAHSSVTTSDVVINEGIRVGFATTYDENTSGTIKTGDLKLIVPGGLLSESQLEHAKIIYKNKTYSLQEYHPYKIYSGVVVKWLVFARAEA